jgi:hypothetical protein
MEKQFGENEAFASRNSSLPIRCSPNGLIASARLQKGLIRGIFIGAPFSSSMRARSCGQIAAQVELGLSGKGLLGKHGQDFASRGKGLTNRGIYL